MKISVLLFLITTCFSWTTLFCQDIRYEDSCLVIGLVNKSYKKNDSVIMMKLKNSNFMELDTSFVFSIQFYNLCKTPITVPNHFDMGEFHIEGMELVSDTFKKIYPLIAYDYNRDYCRPRNKILNSLHMYEVSINYALGYKITKVGTYRFRIAFQNAYNYIPVVDYKTYYTNWMYIKIEE
jgi:hypothetical protein